MRNLATVFVELEGSEIPGADGTFQGFQQLRALPLDDLNPDHCAPCSRQQHLAGPLGFEPRQSAPKALDLPLVDGPVSQLVIDDFRLSIEKQINRSLIVNQQSKINNQKFSSSTAGVSAWSWPRPECHPYAAWRQPSRRLPGT